MVGSHKADHAAFDHGNRLPPVPDVFADQGGGGVSTVDRKRESKRISRLLADVRALFMYK